MRDASELRQSHQPELVAIRTAAPVCLWHLLCSVYKRYPLTVPPIVTLLMPHYFMYRRQYLEQTFSFTCRCPRCADQIDKLCNVPCLRCCPPELQRSSKGYLPPAAHHHPADLGLLFWDPNIASSSTSGTDSAIPNSEPEPKPWQCNRCGAEYIDKDSELVGDYEMIRTATTRLRTWAYGNFMNFDPQDGQQRMEHVAVVLGSSNWAVHAMRAKHSGEHRYLAPDKHCQMFD